MTKRLRELSSLPSIHLPFRIISLLLDAVFRTARCIPAIAYHLGSLLSGASPSRAREYGTDDGAVVARMDSVAHVEAGTVHAYLPTNERRYVPIPLFCPSDYLQ